MRKTIENLYRKHVVEADSDISTIHMLEALKTRTNSLLNILENAKPSIVAEAENVKLFFFVIVFCFVEKFHLKSYVTSLFKMPNVKKNFKQKNLLNN